jgi:hypothetical protein
VTLPGYGPFVLVAIKKANHRGPLPWLATFSDGAALAVSPCGRHAVYVEHDFDPWVLAEPVPWDDIPAEVRDAVSAYARAMDAALRD